MQNWIYKVLWDVTIKWAYWWISFIDNWWTILIQDGKILIINNTRYWQVYSWDLLNYKVNNNSFIEDWLIENKYRCNLKKISDLNWIQNIWKNESYYFIVYNYWIKIDDKNIDNIFIKIDNNNFHLKSIINNINEETKRDNITILNYKEISMETYLANKI